LQRNKKHKTHNSSFNEADYAWTLKDDEKHCFEFKVVGLAWKLLYAGVLWIPWTIDMKMVVFSRATIV
jgi:hypothetical protein